MPLVYRQAVALLDDAHDPGDVREVEAGIDALRVEVQRERHEVDVAGALAVPEQRPLDAIGTGHQRELGRGDRGAAIVVRVDAEHSSRTCVCAATSAARRLMCRTARTATSTTPSRSSAKTTRRKSGEVAL